MAAAQKPESTAVEKRSRVLDLDSAKTEARFVEAFSKGQLDRLKPEEQTMFLMAFGQKIGVRAELGDLMLYQGKPYITIQGRTRLAHQSGLLAGIQPRPATVLERRQFGASDDEVLWVCDVWRHGAPRAFRGWGVCNPTKDRNPVAKSFPREMAKKRAKYDSLVLAFPPDEAMGALHSRYIAEAEEEVKRSMASKQIATATYDEADDVPDGLDGEAIPADATHDEPADVLTGEDA